MIKLTKSTLYKKTNEVIAVKSCVNKAIKVRYWIKNKENALAISFNQLGFLERCFVIREPSKFALSCDIIINPYFQALKSSKEITSEETCLSFPGKVFKLKRYKRVRIIYYDYLEKKIKNMKVDKLLSILFQHEISHLDGKPDDVLVKEQKNEINIRSRDDIS